MLKTSLFIFLISINFATYSQNWAIINTTDKFNYHLDSDNIITQTIWADSLQLNGPDSIFFMNRFLCDSCVIYHYPGNPFDSLAAFKNSPGFLQRKIHFDGTNYNLLDTGNEIIKPFANLNDTWLFDSLLNINATVIFTGQDSLFNSIDSTKTILLSTNDTIILSKDFGIIKYPKGFANNSYFRLTGLEGRNVGESMPKFADFFNFDISDRFEYFESGMEGSDCTYWEIRQYAIDSKNINGDTISFHIGGIFDRNEYRSTMANICTPSHYHGRINETITFIDSLDHFLNKFNRQPVNLSFRETTDQYFNLSLPCGSDSSYDCVRMGVDSNLLTYKSFGSPVYYNALNQNDDTLLRSDATYFESFKIGLGVVEFGINYCFEGYDLGHLVAYSKGNTTVGVFTDSSLILGNQPIDGNKNLFVYPNPANEKLFISYSRNKKYIFQLYDTFGKLLLERASSDSPMEVSLLNLDNGVYFLRGSGNNESFSEKIFVEH